MYDLWLQLKVLWIRRNFENANSKHCQYHCFPRSKEQHGRMHPRSPIEGVALMAACACAVVRATTQLVFCTLLYNEFSN